MSDTLESNGTAVVNWEEKLASFAQEAAKEEAIAGTWVSVKAGRLTIDKVPVAGNVLDCVVIAHAYENVYYDTKFDPNNPKPPACYAIGTDHEDEMVPHEKAAKQQAENCFSCPKNQWGSDPAGGKGKACKNIRRLALLPADALKDAEAVKVAEPVYLKTPVMSVRNWAAYVNATAAEFKRPPFAVMTQISSAPDAKAQFKLTFKAAYKVTEPEVLEALVKRHEQELSTINFPYTVEASAPEAETENEKF